MRTIAEYLAKAAEFAALADAARDAGNKKRFADLAACHRVMAEERARLIAEKLIEPD
jgi:hypothetical protein